MRRLTFACVLASAAAAPCVPVSVSDNVDYNGGDLPNQPVSKTCSTVNDCASLCCADADCQAFSLNAGSAGGRWCYLKGASGYSISPTQGVQSGCFAGACLPPPPPSSLPWFNLSLPVAQRIQLLASNMTLSEAINWLNDGVPAIPRLGLPAYSWEAESSHGVAWNGVATVFPSNIAWGASFDVPLVAAMADVMAMEARAKWVAGRGSDGSSAEFAGLSFMTPNNNLFVSPAWGRGQETYGEDPMLTSQMTYALISSMQRGSDPRYARMIATSKHTFGYHIESWDGDGQYRLSHSYNYSETDLQQYYVAPFRAALAANVTAVMCAYDGANGTSSWAAQGPEPWGIPMCAHPDLQRLLRDPALGWTGYIISDEGAITFMGPGYHKYTNSVQDAACLAMNAGTDLALGGEYASTLATCVSAGNVTEARVRQALTRVLTAQFALGWFDTLAALYGNFSDPVPYNNVGDVNVSTPESRALSHKAAQEGLVLLKNAGGVLPLNGAGVKQVALIGPTANWSVTATGSYLGNYAGCENGPGGSIPSDSRCHVITLVEAMTSRAGTDGWTLSYAPGSDINTANDTSGFAAAIAAAKGADVIVAAVGLNTCQESSCSEGEANDRAVDGGVFPAAGLDLPGSQLPLLQAVAAAYPSTPLIVVLLNGGPISSPWTFSNAAAILEAWYPGYEGGAAITEALFGDSSPAGRMPVTTVTDFSELPPYTDVVLSTPPGRTHWYYSGTPLIPFGFGLSYGNFTYAGMTVTPPSLSPGDDSFTVSATLRNSATARTSDEVVQLYGHFNAASVGYASIPRQQLLAFQRLHDLAPGSSTPVALTVPRSALALVDATGVVGVQSGVWTLWLGGGPPNNTNYGGNPVLVGQVTVQ